MSENEQNMTGDIGFGGINFQNMPTSVPSIIKVIGVGGGGDNAVNHMYQEGIHDVTYLVVNTDRKCLEDSSVPNKLQLGADGLGAGSDPSVAHALAVENKNEICRMLSDDTKMVFITAGMGGGTGTGASPVIAQCAREQGILTVGIVTIPFLFEGEVRIRKALTGVMELSKHVDALLVINNERLRAVYPELTLLNAFDKADNTLTNAARSIADIINMRGKIVVDFQDVTTVLKDGGVAVMSTGYADGENRVTKAIEEALRSPLLGKTDIYNSVSVLVCMYINSEASENQVTMEELSEVHKFMRKFKRMKNFKMGLGTEAGLGDRVKITILATGFGTTNSESDLESMFEVMYVDTFDEPSRPRPNVYLLKPEDMDNDDLISRLEASVTKKRSKEDRRLLEELSSKCAEAMLSAEVQPQEMPVDVRFND